MNKYLRHAGNPPMWLLSRRNDPQEDQGEVEAEIAKYLDAEDELYHRADQAWSARGEK